MCMDICIKSEIVWLNVLQWKQKKNDIMMDNLGIFSSSKKDVAQTLMHEAKFQTKTHN